MTGSIDLGAYDLVTSSSVEGITKIIWSDGTVQVSSPSAGGFIGTATSDLDMNEYDIVDVASITVTNPLMIKGDYVRIGDAGAVSYMDGDGDLAIESEIYVQSTAHLDGGGNMGGGCSWNNSGYQTMNNDIGIWFGNPVNNYFKLTTAGNDHLITGIKTGAATTSGNWTVLHYDARDDDFTHAVTGHPYFIIHSSTRAATATNQYIGFRHNGIEGEINSETDIVVDALTSGSSIFMDIASTNVLEVNGSGVDITGNISVSGTGIIKYDDVGWGFPCSAYIGNGWAYRQLVDTFTLTNDCSGNCMYIDYGIDGTDTVGTTGYRVSVDTCSGTFYDLCSATTTLQVIADDETGATTSDVKLTVLPAGTWLRFDCLSVG